MEDMKRDAIVNKINKSLDYNSKVLMGKACRLYLDGNTDEADKVVAEVNSAEAMRGKYKLVWGGKAFDIEEVNI